MTLPRDVARCPGKRREVNEGDWPFPAKEEDCLDCARRTQGIADYMAGVEVLWMPAPKERPCPERIARKGAE